MGSDNIIKGPFTGKKPVEKAPVAPVGIAAGYATKLTPPIMKFFAYEHLHPKLQEVSKPICDVARIYEASLPDSAEKAAGLRKLMEAKDCMVRAAL